jgi:hypothetical protein
VPVPAPFPCPTTDIAALECHLPRSFIPGTNNQLVKPVLPYPGPIARSARPGGRYSSQVARTRAAVPLRIGTCGKMAPSLTLTLQ